jgi:hypothetical protein
MNPNFQKVCLTHYTLLPAVVDSVRFQCPFIWKKWAGEWELQAWELLG